MAANLKETDLYPALADFFRRQGFTVRSEVNGCDVVATREEQLVIVELKVRFNLDLVLQLAKRQHYDALVYAAIVAPGESMHSAKWRDRCHLLRRLEVGLFLVNPRRGTVEVVLEPRPFDRSRSIARHSRQQRDLITEISRRSGDYNQAGSSRKKLMTAYRENAIFIACCLKEAGPLTPKQLRELGTGPKTQSILAKNFYGWFRRVKRGVYALTLLGEKSLEEHTALAEMYTAYFHKQREKTAIGQMKNEVEV